MQHVLRFQSRIARDDWHILHALIICHVSISTNLHSANFYHKYCPLWEMLRDGVPKTAWCYKLSSEAKGKLNAIERRSTFKLNLHLSGSILQSGLSASDKWTLTFGHSWRLESAQVQCLLHMRGTDNECIWYEWMFEIKKSQHKWGCNMGSIVSVEGWSLCLHVDGNDWPD